MNETEKLFRTKLGGFSKEMRERETNSTTVKRTSHARSKKPGKKNQESVEIDRQTASGAAQELLFLSRNKRLKGYIKPIVRDQSSTGTLEWFLLFLFILFFLCCFLLSFLFSQKSLKWRDGIQTAAEKTTRLSNLKGKFNRIK